MPTGLRRCWSLGGNALAAEAKLTLLAGVGPITLDLASSGRPREIWAEQEEKDDIGWCRHVIREVITPRILRASKQGRRGPDPDRVIPDWR